MEQHVMRPPLMFLKIDKGWGKLLEEYDSAKQILSEYRSGSGVIILGSTRTRDVSGIDPSYASNKKTIPFNAHGFIAGGKVIITGDSNHEGTFVVDSTTTVNSLVIQTTKTDHTAFANGAKITQNPDFQTLGHLVSVMKEGIAQERRNGLQVLYGQDLSDAIEQISLAEIPNSTPSELNYSALIAKVQNMNAYTPNYFPSNQVWLTNPKNLSIYELKNSRVRKVNEEPYT